mgnify:CR=1 FL=1
MRTLQSLTGGGSVVEVGCGSGYVICSVALALQQALQQPAGAGPSAPRACSGFLAVDINAAALAATAQTLAAHKVCGLARLLVSWGVCWPRQPLPLALLSRYRRAGERCTFQRTMDTWNALSQH